jgi:hypothetical protein
MSDQTLQNILNVPPIYMIIHLSRFSAGRNVTPLQHLFASETNVLIKEQSGVLKSMSKILSKTTVTCVILVSVVSLRRVANGEDILFLHIKIFSNFKI